MTDPRFLVVLLWLAFSLLWLVLGQLNKKASKGTPWWLGWRLRVAIIVAVIVFISLRHQAVSDHAVPAHLVRRFLSLHSGIAGQWVGVVLCVLGFGFAFWARGSIGRNWGMPMSLREGHELVTTGPYAYVRHPIYSGLMLAMIGTALVLSLLWMIIFPLYFAYFLFSARTEEKMMLAQFPDAYPAYRRRTKMLIPFVF
jgi:protein-S-isoprenylcysteine O-methyltransferase Ste14